MDRDEILEILRAFEDVGLEYVLIGATAMGIHGLWDGLEGVSFHTGGVESDQFHASYLQFNASVFRW